MASNSANTIPASLPPRKARKPPDGVKVRRRQLQTPLDILRCMGFTEHRALKALAATGYQSVQVASDWLLSHVNDPLLDAESDREYILYLCPMGELRCQLEEIATQTREQCGWNTAHNYMPHCTLCSFFKAKDAEAPALIKALEILQQKVLTTKMVTSEIPVELSITEKFVGLNLGKEPSAFLQQLTHQFDNLLQMHNIKIQPQQSKMHISIGYGFQPRDKRAIMGIAEDVLDGQLETKWELRLYSRDAKLAKHQVHKVLYPHQAESGDELDLIKDDYIYVEDSEVENSPDGWYQGTSWLTGCTGLYPGNYTSRVAASEAWTLVKSVPLVKNEISHRDNLMDTSDGTTCNSEDQPVTCNGEVDSNYQNMGLYAHVKKRKIPRQLFVIRHGERVDFVFGKNWYQKAFGEAGNYIRYNMNMPAVVPERKWGPNEWREDCPITEQGAFQSRFTGECLKEKGVKIDHVYVSPAFRCVQTCAGILTGLGLDLPMHIEPGLYEWMGWYKKYAPQWYSPAELKAMGFNIDTDYSPILPKEKLSVSESIQDLYERSFTVSKEILKKHKEQGGNVLIVGHAGSLDTNTRQLVGGEPGTFAGFHTRLVEIPFLAVAVCKEFANGQRWELVEPPIYPFTHSGNKYYNWQILRPDTG